MASMTDKKRYELEVFRELEKAFNKYLNDPKYDLSSFFYYFDRPKNEKKFWDTVKDLHKRRFLTEKALNTINKYEEKTPTIHLKSYINIPSSKEEENPISFEGKIYYNKLNLKEKLSDTPWYEKINPLGAFIKDTWLGRLLITLITAWAAWTIKITYEYYASYPKINNYLQEIIKKLDK